MAKRLQRNSSAPVAVAVEQVIQRWILKPDRQRVTTAAIRIDDGRYVATIIENPDITAQAPTKAEAERIVLQGYRDAQQLPKDREREEDEREMREVLKRQRTRT